MYCEPLRSNPKNKELINNFVIEREEKYRNIHNQIIGLEAYLKHCAWEDDESGQIRAYVIKPYFSDEIIAYFAIRAGMVSVDSELRNFEREFNALQEGTKLVPDTIPGIEISHFAVNDAYRKKHSKNGTSLKGLGKYLYPEFIYPIIHKVTLLLGVNILYLYAAGDEKLKNYYEKVFGFSRLKYDEKIVPVTSYYDDNCEFMFRLL